MICTSGTCHQGSFASYGQGFQCTMTATVAVLAFLSCRFSSPAHWSPSELDHITLTGSRLYDSVVYPLPPRYLMHNDIPSDLTMWGNRYSVDLQQNTMYGVVGQPGDESAMSFSINDAFQQSLVISPGCIFTAGGLSIAIISEGSDFYIYDSHARNTTGFPSSNGNAVLLRFTSNNEMIRYIETVYQQQEFNLSPLVLLSCDSINTIPINDNANAHTSFSDSLNCVNVPSSSMKSFVDFFSDSDFQHSEKPSVGEESYIENPSNTHLHMANTNHTYCSYATVSDAKNNCNISCQLEHSGTYISSSEHTSLTDMPLNYIITNTENIQDNAKTQKSHAKNCGHPLSLGTGRIPINAIQSANQNMLQNCKPTPTERETECFDLEHLQNPQNSLQNHSYSLSCEIVNTEHPLLLDNSTNDYCTSHISQLPCNDKRFTDAINLLPCFACTLCDRFLFKDQVKTCKKRIDTMFLSINDTLCSFCYQCVNKGKTSYRSQHCNNLYTGDIPRQLKGLGLTEKRLISKINTFFTLVILPCFPIGQFAQKGFAIHFKTDLTNFVRKLPCTSGLDSFVCLTNSNRHEVIPFNKTVVTTALQWLNDNNRMYNDVQLDDDILSGHSNSTVEIDCINNLLEFGAIEIDYANNISSDPVPFQLDDIPIDFLRMAHAEELAFPWLFPYGYNGYDASRPQKLTLSQYYKIRLYSFDARWRKDVSYLMHAVNTLEKNALSNCISTYMRIYKGMAADSPLMTASDLQSNNTSMKENSFMFMKKIRGTAAYWKNNLLNLLAMIRNIGPPTIFMTLSSNDYHWKELAMSLQLCMEKDVDFDSLPQMVQSDPLMTAIHFDRRWRSLLKYVLKSEMKPLGVIQDYFIRVEFQARGSPHLHIFFWIKDAPSMDSCSSELHLINYIDKIICTQIPDRNVNPELHDLVMKLQVHSHRKYCQRNGKCRFSFPFNVCPHTKLVVPVTDGKKRMNKFYETKRNSNETMINPYNPVILAHWKANMDIQMVGGAYGIACYICSYICKAEPDTLRNALSDIFSSLKESPQPLRKKMFTIGMCVLKHRTLSAQEAAYRLSDLDFISTSRETVHLSALPPHKQFKLLKSQKELQNLQPTSTNIFSDNNIDDYHNRPSILENISLFQYVQCYKRFYGKIPMNTKKNIMRLRNSEKMISKRNNLAIVRVHHAPMNTDDYFYGLIMIYYPHRFYSEIIGNATDAKSAFIEKHDYFDKDAVSSCYTNPSVDDAIRAIRAFQLQQQWEMNEEEADEQCSTDSHRSVMVEDISLNHEVLEHNLASGEIESSVNSEAFINMSTENEWHSICTGVTSNNLSDTYNILTGDQKRVFSYVTAKFRKHEPFQIFITGGAGVGKSFIVSLIIKWLRLNTATISGSETVCVTAPTGVAAYNIHGNTIHSSLNLPVQHSWNTSYTDLNVLALKKLRSKFRHVHSIIIDEISMVSDVQLTNIHRRLTAIKQNEQPFGGLNILVVGDFFQLRPVRGRFVFKNDILWSLFTPFHLKENVRQSQNSSFASLLNRARIGQLTCDDIQTLKSRLMPYNDLLNSSILHIYPTKHEVNLHNSNMQNLLTSQSTKFIANHSFSLRDIGKNSVVTSQFIPNDDREAGGLPFQLCLSVGTKVMLLRNLNIAMGLVNGAIGTITELPNAMHDTLYINFSSLSTPLVFNRTRIPISKYQQEYLYNGRYIIRRNFPVIPCWATTIHKVQGLTLDKVAVSIGTSVFEKGQAYVALSRVNKLKNLFLVAFSEHKLICDPEVLQQYLNMYINKSTSLLESSLVTSIFVVIVQMMCRQVLK